MFTDRKKLEDGSLQFAVKNEPVLNVKYDDELSENANSNWYIFTVDDHKMLFGIKGNYLNGIYTFLLEAKNYLPPTVFERHSVNLKLILNDWF